MMTAVKIISVTDVGGAQPIVLRVIITLSDYLS